MRFTETFIVECGGHLIRMGLQRCPICGTEEALAVEPRPVFLSIGSPFYSDKEDPRRDADSNMLFMLRIFCDNCGYTLLFDSEKFRSGDTPILFRGTLAEELDKRAKGEIP